MTGEVSFPNKHITFALGSGYNLGRAKNKSETLKKFADRFRKPAVSSEKRHEYLKLSDKRQAYLKGTNGWFMRAHVEKGKRTRNSIQPGDCITLDMDYCTPEYLKQLTDGEVCPGMFFFLHTTRSHTPENPRVRMVIPLKGQVPSEAYQKASRIIRTHIDPEGVYTDKVSFRVAQMMYFPTVSKDMEKYYTFYAQEGELWDWKQLVSDWEEVNGSADNLGNLPRVSGEDELRDTDTEAEDPLSKSGPVGNFCRAYSITELVDGKDGDPGILSGVYEPTEYHEGAISRMTYIHGSTSNGAVVYDDKFVYSHHGSDPAQDKTLNAYDLVRCHLYDELDERIDPDTPMGQRPSVKKMNEEIAKDPNYKAAVVEERYDLEEMFANEDDQDWIESADEDDEINRLLGDTPVDEKNSAEEDDDISDLLGVPVHTVVKPSVTRYKRTFADKPPKGWVASELEMDKEGSAKSTLHNITTIITNDPRFFRKIAFNEFSNQVVLLSDLKTKSKVVPPVICSDPENGMLWQDTYDLSIRAIIEAPNGKGKPGYGFKVSDRDLVGGVKIAARNNSFHPIREEISRWRDLGRPEKPIMDTFLQRHVGADDTAFTREAFKMMMVASIARVEDPGCKFDYAIILEGPQGVGKSTLIKLLYGEDNFGEIDVDLKDRKQVAEQIAGKWGLELPELSSFHKTDHNEAKHFMRRQDDDVRLSYDRSVTRLPRQCVFWGTTNDSKYLRDPTGNRSWWPVKCDGRMIDFAAVLRERDDLWAEAVAVYDEMRRQHNGDLPLTLTGKALEQAQRLQERARKKELWEDWYDKIEDWMDQKTTIQNIYMEQHRAFDALDDVNEDQLVERVAFCQKTALEEALDFAHGTITDNVKQLTWNAVIDQFEKTGWKRDQTRVGGFKQRWIIHPSATKEDLVRGYFLPPEGPTESDDESLI